MIRNNRPGLGKAPKLRFQAGSFVQDKRTKEILCIRVIYRTKDDPTVWKFVLEYREDLKPHGTHNHLDALIVANCEGADSSVVIKELLRTGMEWHEQYPNMLMNSCVHVTNKTLLNYYKVISSGEVVEGERQKMLKGEQ